MRERDHHAIDQRQPRSTSAGAQSHTASKLSMDAPRLHG
jgi:hypothetical protein